MIAAGRDVSTALALASVAGDRFEWLETNGPAIFPVFRPPDGAELLFAGGSVDAGGMALYALDLASRQITQIAAPRKGGQFTGSPQYSPDGTRIAYTYWISGTPDVGVVLYEERESRVHIVDAEGATEPVRIPVPDGLCCDGFPAWSNDGTRLAFVRWYDVPADKGIAIVPVEIGGAGRWYPVPSLDTVRLTWSPDDRFLLVTPLDSSDIRLPQVRLDVETGAIVDIPWETTSDPAWQRLAP
ncbi:MAG: transcriptional regulatory protein-like protein [Chloroflexi bacterium]|nr:transcriptional regulatory protein-like protein [Chloroflexota bacterium]